MVTRDVEATAVADLALAPPRAALAVTIDDEIHVLPIGVSVEDPAAPGASPRIMRVPEDAPDLADRNVVVIADDGPQWFRLRSLTVRGKAISMGDQSYRLVPTRVVAWDYGSLHYAPTPPDTVDPRQPVFSGASYTDINPLTSPNLDAALSAARVMILATHSERGTPFAVPLWFVMADHGRIFAGTSASSWTVRNVASRSQVALLFGGENGRDSHRLLVRGRARAVSGPPPPAVLARIAWRYYLAPQFAAAELNHLRLWRRRMRYYAQSQAAHVIITPQSAIECRAPHSHT
ncbi:pyridoxamine 5'-phosphate oxidase family protein [Nocardia sp. NPDC049707]|uniref:pyridoxamine 5'-phosphate oxidase family protein n=1 Tax=Nocardia sp. NPDC049707 TaxID=3154735 RepID=UPI00341A2DB9